MIFRTTVKHPLINVYEQRNKLKAGTLHPIKEINSTTDRGGNSINATDPMIEEQSIEEHSSDSPINDNP